MVTLDAIDIIPLRDFDLAWRITDPRWASLPETALREIKPLAAAKARELWAQVSAVWRNLSPTPALGRPPSGSRDGRQLAITQERSLEASGLLDDAGCQCWFRDLPIDPDEQVYLCWSGGEGGVAAATDWGTFLEHWEDLWYPFDELGIFDETRGWAVLLGPGEIARFAAMVGKQVGA